MNITIHPKPLTGSVSVVSSKSLSHRYLIAAALAKGTSTIDNVLDSLDISATQKALKSFGIAFDQNQVIGGKWAYDGKVIDCDESGSTLRFMIPLALLSNEKVTFDGKGRLPERTLEVYFNMMDHKQLHYKRFGEHNLPLEVQGPLRGGYYFLRGDISSQFLSGFLFALPLVAKDSVIEVLTPLESKGYVGLTLGVLKQFGIHVIEADQFYYIRGGQSYNPQNLIVEADYSQAAFWMVASLIGKQINLFNLNPISKQGDAKILDIIKEMEGEILYDEMEKMYQITPGKTYGTTIDLSQIPDLGPILMVLAALSEYKTTFLNASRLRIKESDRLEAMVQTLTKFGVQITVEDDTVTIIGQQTLKGNQTFDAYNDHRIAMAIAIAAIRADGPVTIIGAESVNKSYPDFFKVYEALGGDIHES